jgi:hypothetical protein
VSTERLSGIGVDATRARSSPRRRAARPERDVVAGDVDGRASSPAPPRVSTGVVVVVPLASIVAASSSIDDRIDGDAVHGRVGSNAVAAAAARSPSVDNDRPYERVLTTTSSSSSSASSETSSRVAFSSSSIHDVSTEAKTRRHGASTSGRAKTSRDARVNVSTSARLRAVSADARRRKVCARSMVSGRRATRDGGARARDLKKQNELSTRSTRTGPRVPLDRRARGMWARAWVCSRRGRERTRRRTRARARV